MELSSLNQLPSRKSSRAISTHQRLHLVELARRQLPQTRAWMCRASQLQLAARELERILSMEGKSKEVAEGRKFWDRKTQIEEEALSLLEIHQPSQEACWMDEGRAIYCTRWIAASSQCLLACLLLLRRIRCARALIWRWEAEDSFRLNES